VDERADPDPGGPADGEPAADPVERLRAECLRLRGSLYDPNTSLPALPAVIDDARRRIEAGERLGLVYLDLSSEEQLEAVYGWEVYDGILRQVAQNLVAFQRQYLAPADVVAQLEVRGDEFMVVAAPGGRRGSEGVALQALRNQLSVELDRAMQVQFDNQAPRGLQLLSAAAMVRFDPTQRIERSVYRCLEHLRGICRREREQKHTLRLNELRRIVQQGDIRVRYQPIVHLADGRVHGFEALSCGPEGDIFESTEMLFTFAEGSEHIVELERLCRAESMRGAVRLPGRAKLFLNCSAHGLADPELVERGAAQAEAHGLRPEDVVFEVTERVAATAWRQFRDVVLRLRRDGFAIAVDDTGSGYSSLHSVAEIEPDYLKLDISLVRDVHRSSIKRNLLETLVGFAGKLDAQVVAEGVEKEEEFRALRGLGIPLGQGYYFAPPDPEPGQVYFPEVGDLPS
jgi:EAL domain-containing protein (putative c-di-GMP-specific phosphodiesterase class I)/GGDEF domain-containing protein